LGSHNGTYVNGKKIGQHVTSQVKRDIVASHPPPVVLSDGDEIRLGEHTVFRVGVYTEEGEKNDQTTRNSSGELSFDASVHL
jgi:pSer/pThr/pTyr-binding forkhead associated (FHA) protein